MRRSQRKIKITPGKLYFICDKTWIQIIGTETTRLQTVLRHWHINEERLQIEGEPTKAVGKVPERD